MIKGNRLLNTTILVIVIFMGIILLSCGGGNGNNKSTTPSKSWSVTQKGSILEVSYGSGTDFSQYAVLHLGSSFFRMNYGPGSGWGTSVILLPSFWEKGTYYQGALITATWKADAADLVIPIVGSISSLNVQGQLRLSPPTQNSISAAVTIDVDGSVVLDNRPGEAFKSVMFSSMHISKDKWDAQSAYVDSQSFQIPQSGWIIEPPAIGNVFGLKGGTSSWKSNAPTIEIILDQSMQITGWVTPSNDPNDDNFGFWTASDKIISSWQYTIIAKP